MAEGRRIRSTRSAEPIPLSSPLAPAGPGLVSIRGFKQSIDHLPATHPLKVLMAGEPDEMTAAEFMAKAVGWWRLRKLPSA